MALNITQGERIMLGRRRANVSQQDFARRRKVSQSLVSRWESGELEPPAKVGKMYKGLGRLTKVESSIVMRKRMGKTVLDIAQALCVSRYQATKMAKGEVESTEYFKYITDEYVKYDA